MTLAYSIVYQKTALKVLLRMPRNEAMRIREAVERLASDPMAAGMEVKALRGRPGYRLRVGDWRVIFERQDGQLLVLVLEIGARGSIYP